MATSSLSPHPLVTLFSWLVFRVCANLVTRTSLVAKRSYAFLATNFPMGQTCDHGQQDTCSFAGFLFAFQIDIKWDWPVFSDEATAAAGGTVVVAVTLPVESLFACVSGDDGCVISPWPRVAELKHGECDSLPAAVEHSQCETFPQI